MRVTTQVPWGEEQARVGAERSSPLSSVQEVVQKQGWFGCPHL